MPKSILIWPPPYTLTRRKLARHVTIKITLSKGLEFVVPKTFNKNYLPKLLKTNKHWIQKQLAIVYRDLKEIRTCPLPKKIDLAAVKQTWRVKYKASSTAHSLVEDTKQKILTLTGKIKNKSACRVQLNLWIKAQAKKILIPKLHKLSQTTHLKYKDAIIRKQTGQWASCSSHRRISLNCKILFLQPALCKYIFIHELCHLKQLNHSEKFWRLVAKYDQKWLEHDMEVQKSDKLLPVWAREY